MPLNDDPEAISDDDYEALSAELRAAAEAEGAPVCDVCVPPDVLADALARLDSDGE